MHSVVVGDKSLPAAGVGWGSPEWANSYQNSSWFISSRKKKISSPLGYGPTRMVNFYHVSFNIVKIYC